MNCQNPIYPFFSASALIRAHSKSMAKEAGLAHSRWASKLAGEGASSASSSDVHEGTELLEVKHILEVETPSPPSVTLPVTHEVCIVAQTTDFG